MTNHFDDSQWPNKSIGVISFTGNSLVHLTPFPKIAIEKLFLQNNQINKIDDGTFLKLINLTELDLSHNNLTAENLHPAAFQVILLIESFKSINIHPTNVLTTLFHTLRRIKVSLERSQS